MRCKACDKILERTDWKFNSRTQDFDELCLKCRSFTFDEDEIDYDYAQIRENIRKTIT